MKVEDLKVGQSMLTRVREVANGKYQVEIAQLIPRTDNVNILGILNTGDERFDKIKPKARRAWDTAEKAMLTKFFGINEASLSKLEKGDWLEVGILNPSVINPINGAKVIMGVQIEETTIPTEAQAADVEKFAKKTKDGEYLICKETGNYIFCNTRIVELSKANHTYIACVPQSKYVAKVSEQVFEDAVPTLD